MTNLVGHTVEFPWKRTLVMWMFVIQYVNLVFQVWPALVPEASHGITALAQRDLRMSPAFMATIFLFGIGISWRGVRARWWLLVMLLGQGIMAALSVGYALRSEVTFAQVAGHLGLFLLCFFGIIAFIPVTSITKDEWLGHHKLRLVKFSKTLLIPIIGFVLLLYAVGLATRPDGGIAMFIRSQFGTPLIVMLVAAFALGAGVVIQNHISASRLFVALIPQLIYACMAIGLLGADNDISLTGVIVHLLFFITAAFIVLIQTKEYARALRTRQRQGA